MAVRDEQVFPSVIVEVQKGRPPFHILGVHRKTGRTCDVFEVAIPKVSIKRIRVAGEIGLEDVQISVAVVVGRRGAHARLLAAVLVHCESAHEPRLFKCPVAFVVKEQTGRRVAGDIKIGPAVIIEVAGQDGESVILMRCFDAGLFGDIDEVTVPIVVIERHRLPFEASRAAGDRHTFPIAAALGARRRRILSFEIDIVGHHEIEISVAIVIDKRTSCAPTRFRLVKPTLLRFVAERTVSHIMQEHVVPPLADEEIHVAIVIRVAGAHPLRPAEVADAGFDGNILKTKSTQVVVEMRRQRRAGVLQPVALQKKDVRKAVVVVIEYRNAGAGVFYDVGLIHLAGDYFGGESRLRRDIAEIDNGCLHAWRKRADRLIRSVPRSHLGKQLRSDGLQRAHHCERGGNRNKIPVRQH